MVKEATYGEWMHQKWRLILASSAPPIMGVPFADCEPGRLGPGVGEGCVKEPTADDISLDP